MKKIILMFVLLLFGCNTIKYQDDIGYLNSAQAGSYEFPVKIGRSVCKDMNNEVGLCSTRLPNNQDLNIEIEPQPYAYTYVLTCSSALDVNHSANILANTAATIIVPFTHYGALKAFTCIVQINPMDRQKVSAQAEVRVVLFDANYQAREKMYTIELKGDNYLVLGQHARHSIVCERNKCKSYNKDTIIKIKEPRELLAYSESYQMRYNYYGY